MNIKEILEAVLWLCAFMCCVRIHENSVFEVKRRENNAPDKGTTK